GRLEDQGFEPRSFDAVLMRENTLGAFEQPADALNALRTLLRADGALIVSERFPQLDGAYEEIRSRGSEALRWLAPAAHRFVLSKDGASKLLTAAGLAAIDSKPLKQRYLS